MTRFSKKVCLLGDFAVGKTSLVRRFVEGIFEDKYLSSIGVKIDRKTVLVSSGDNRAELTMMLWDLAGSERFNQIRANYLRGSAGAILVCDITRPETLDNLKIYVSDLRRVSPKVQLVLAINKSDLIQNRQLTMVQIETVAANLNTPFFFTSAKTGNTVEELFNHLGQLIIA